MAKSQSGYNHIDGIYTSLRRPLLLPRDQNLSMVSFLFRNSHLYPTKPALIDADSGDSLTFSQFESTVAKVSHGLHQLGIKKNDVVLLYAPNSIPFPVSFFSVIALGAIATTVNPIYTVHEISKQVKDCKPKLIIMVAELWDKVKGFNLPSVILGSENLTQSMREYPKSKITLYNDLIKNSNPGSVLELPNVPINQSDTASLLYLSGTTGTSKGVMLTHGNFIATATMVANDQDVQGEMHSVLLCVLPMFHVFGLATLNHAQLQRGNAVVSMVKFDFGMILKSIEKCTAYYYPFTEIKFFP